MAKVILRALFPHMLGLPVFIIAAHCFGLCSATLNYYPLKDGMCLTFILGHAEGARFGRAAYGFKNRCSTSELPLNNNKNYAV